MLSCHGEESELMLAMIRVMLMLDGWKTHVALNKYTRVTPLCNFYKIVTYDNDSLRYAHTTTNVLSISVLHTWSAHYLCKKYEQQWNIEII